MKVTVLMEDTPGPRALPYEHGLSFFIETELHHLLFDTGASDLTWQNAVRLQIPLEKTDAVILSHGHYDHTGGVLSFSKMYPRVPVYLRPEADGCFYHDEKYIGTDPQLAGLPQLVRPEETITVLDRELTLMAGVTGRRCQPQSNASLFRLVEGKRVPDQFCHEQSLIVNTGNKRYLFAGCAHNGILNILDRFREVFGCVPDALFGGFHMSQKTCLTDRAREDILTTARELAAMPTVFYTGHCTGEEAFGILHEIMGSRLHALHAGDMIEL